jgi:hypothetical protein
VAALRTRINEGDIKAITWYLERSDSATWGERTKVDINLETLEPPSPDPKVVAAKEQRLDRAEGGIEAQITEQADPKLVAATIVQQTLLAIRKESTRVPSTDR